MINLMDMATCSIAVLLVFIKDISLMERVKTSLFKVHII
jgi:hypothetical protein